MAVSWISSAQPSSDSQATLDELLPSVVFSFMVVSPSAGPFRPCFCDTEGYPAFTLFPHLLMVAPRKARVRTNARGAEDPAGGATATDAPQQNVIANPAIVLASLIQYEVWSLREVECRSCFQGLLVR